ncbi:inorganic phosphate transporter [Deefgea tanakiae]|jgi:low-affinity inorganic phosphate transporter|uniref:Phosphate transporter n=1 Tax=Deefgea tanakiae TaxID=2865840 RepID=A0ABX8Z914_9NEIS|nr:inorganic phosphate transporter [Deefgea tanakiae]QZA78910.1 inorganic phosphate transporter [Deefgea tanakiae]
MPEIFSGLDTLAATSLALAILFVLAYEFINGFHDTANAVATVIYTKAMPANVAVIASGCFNFLGVMLGGLGVAYAIIHLLPVELLLNVNSSHGLIMVFSLLTAAIVWNLGTWYLGIPASSSHTLIGSILGVGIMHAILTGNHWLHGINTKKAIDILLSLLISPALGMILAGVLLIALKRYFSQSHMHLTPEERKDIDGKKHPPFWTRVTLIVSAMGLSFAHGSNDGQKGIGLVMLVLVGLAPGNFVLDRTSSIYDIERTRDAAIHIRDFYTQNADKINPSIQLGAAIQELPAQFECKAEVTLAAIDKLNTMLGNIRSYNDLSTEQRITARRILLCVDDTSKKIAKLPVWTSHEKHTLNQFRKDLTATTEYAPQWVIVAVALALGLGTMVGWRRIVHTVGEKIGNKGMTYSQGNAAQITAAAAIGIASWTGMPVSTTHILSSAVAGTMVANKSGLQASTIKNIVIAWVLTLPVTIAMSGGLFWIASKIFV